MQQNAERPASAGDHGRAGEPGTPTEARNFARRLAQHCATFRGADTQRGLWQLVNTLVPFLVLCALMLACYERAYWVTLLLTVPAGGLLVRLFIIQHDCGHGSFLARQQVNDWLGRALSVLTATPYGYWRRAHAIHHASSGNLDRRGIGDITTLTVREYQALPMHRRLFYRLYRNPIVLLILGVPIHFIVQQRIPVGMSLPFRDVWKSVIGLNTALAALYGGLMWAFGAVPFLVVYLPVVVIASWIGGWLFFIQHQFEETHWEKTEGWDKQVAALLGSSYYVLPQPLQWFTGNIGLHHIHHLNSSIPNYRLPECLAASPELAAMNRLTFWESLKCVRLVLWDEERRRLIRFSDVVWPEPVAA